MKRSLVLAAAILTAQAVGARAEEEPDCQNLYNPDAQWVIDRNKDLDQRYPGETFAEDRKAFAAMFASEGETCRFFAGGFFFKREACKAACLKYKELEAKAGRGDGALEARCKSTPTEQLLADRPLYRSCMDLFIKQKGVTEQTCRARRPDADPREALVCARLAARGGDAQAETAAIAAFQAGRARRAQELGDRAQRAVTAARAEAGRTLATPGHAVSEPTREPAQTRPVSPAAPLQAHAVLAEGVVGARGWGVTPTGEIPAYAAAVSKIEDAGQQKAVQRAISYGPLVGRELARAQAGCAGKGKDCLSAVHARYARFVAGDARGMTVDERVAFAQACGSARSNARPQDDADDAAVRLACRKLFAPARAARAAPPSPSSAARAPAAAAVSPETACPPQRRRQKRVVLGTRDECQDSDPTALGCEYVTVCE